MASNYHESVAIATKRAYLQTQSITYMFGLIAAAITRTVVEDSPDRQKLMDEANSELDEATRTLELAIKQVESAQQKVLEATEVSLKQDAALKGIAGHTAEVVEQVIEHQDYGADVATLAAGAKMLTYDEQFMAWLLNEADGTKFGMAVGRLSPERLHFLRQVIEQEATHGATEADNADTEQS